MLRYALKRILMMIPILLAVTLIIFTLVYITPGNPAELLLCRIGFEIILPR